MRCLSIQERGSHRRRLRPGQECGPPEAKLSNVVLRTAVWILVLAAALIVSIVGGLYVAGFVMGPPAPHRPAAGSATSTPPTAGTPPPAINGSAAPATPSGNQGTTTDRLPQPVRPQLEIRLIPGTTVEVGQDVTLLDASLIPTGDSATNYEWRVAGPDATTAVTLTGAQATFTPKREGTYRVRLTIDFRRAGKLQSDEVTFVAGRPAPAAPGQSAESRKTAGPITIWKEGTRVFFQLSSKELGVPERSLANRLTVEFWFGANEQSRFGPGDYLTDTPLVLTTTDVDIYSVRITGQLANGRALNETYSFQP